MRAVSQAGPVLTLRPPGPGDEDVARAAQAALQAEGFGFGCADADERWSDYLTRLERDRLGFDLPPGRVPATFLYADVDGRVVGRASVRHRLNEQLLRIGGHIGYAVLPAFRRRGYGTEILRQSLALARGCGDMRSTAMALDNLGDALCGLGDSHGARSCYAESLPLFREIDDHRSIAQSLESFARLAAAERDACRAATLTGAAAEIRRAVDSPPSPYEERRQEQLLADARAALGEAAFSVAWSEGEAMSLEQAIVCALDEGGASGGRGGEAAS